jgi:hypothetical protein
MSKKTFHKIQSFLSLRKPSNKDDEKFISEIESPYQAAKLRSASKGKSVDSFHSPVNFSWSAFWKSLIYENLPPVIFSPLAAIFLEGSLSRAWHVSQNRGLIAVSTKHHPIDFIIQSWLIVYPCSWLMNIGLFLALFSDKQLILNIDPFHMILAYLLLFFRRLIIATKYGYFRPEDLERLCLPAPDWDNNKTVRRLIAQGWLRPWAFPGLIEDELTIAMDENDICLQGIPIEPGREARGKLINNSNSELFPASTGCTKENELPSGFILYNIIKSVYMLPALPIMQPLTYLCMLLLPAAAFLPKYFFGIDLFGITIQEKIISVASLIGFINGFQLMMFGMVCAADYQRRFETSKKLGELVSYPGLKLSSIFKSFYKDKNEDRIFIDLQKRVNVFAWMNMRNVLRSFGETYYLRIQGYTSILIFYSLLCVAILNIIVWTGMKHHISTVFVIGAVITAVSIICLFAISKAIQLQSLSAKHRDFIRNELFIIEEEIWEMKLAGKKEERINDLLSAKALLQQVDESINYKELIYKPTTIFGYAANNGVMGSVLGLILTGFLFAVQGFVSVGIAYNSFGWFIP